MNNQTDNLRKDILHNAPLPCTCYGDVRFQDVQNILFRSKDGTLLEVEDYEMRSNKTLVVQLK